MNTSTRITIASSTIVKTIVWVLIFAGLFYMSDLVITVLVAVVLASAIEPAVRLLARHKIPRVVSVLGLFLVLIGLATSVAFIFIPPLADDAAQLMKSLPQIVDSVRIFGRDLGFKDLAAQLALYSHDISKGQILTILKTTLFGQTGFFATTSIVFSGAFHVVITFVIAFYLALEENGVQKFLGVFAPVEREEYIQNLWTRAQRKISLWMQGQFLLSFFVALLVYIPNLILGIPYAALLAILAFIGELIPVVGLTLATVPALFLAWTHGGVPLLGTVAVIYFLISQLESHVLYPRIMNRVVGVPSVIIIIALLAGAKLAGIWGVLLAVPLASIAVELIGDYDKRKRGNV
jgi:predicted PurR-regulated permease PerM